MSTDSAISLAGRVVSTLVASDLAKITIENHERRVCISSYGVLVSADINPRRTTLPLRVDAAIEEAVHKLVGKDCDPYRRQNTT